MFCLLWLGAAAQQRLELWENDGFGWVKVMGKGNLVGALDDGDSVLVPLRYCYVEYQKGIFVADSCVDEAVVGVAAYNTDGECIIPASRGYTKIRPMLQKGGRFLQVRTMVDRRSYWGVCDIYGNEVISPLMYGDVMGNPHGLFYYTDKGFAVKRESKNSKKPKYTYLDIYVDEEGRMYQLDEDGQAVYLADYE